MDRRGSVVVAVNAIARGASLTRGSLTLIAMRAGLLVLAGLPALVVVASAMSGGAANMDQCRNPGMAKPAASSLVLSADCCSAVRATSGGRTVGQSASPA